MSKLTQRMIWVMAAASLVFILGAVIYYRSLAFLPFALGVLLLSGSNAVKLILLERSAKEAIERGEGGANYMRLQAFLRLVLTAAMLIIAAVVPFINLWGAVLGLFTFQIAAWSIKFISKPDELL